MEVIIYSHADNSQKDILLKRISEVIQPAPVMIFNVNGLLQLLKSKISGEVIVVFMISSEEELDSLHKNKSQFFNTKYIIVLPENHESLTSKGLSLQPRYLTYPTQAYTDVGKVLDRMIRKYNQ